MFVSNQSAKLKIFNTSSNKNLLIQGINNLSNRIQKEYSLNETNSINSNRSQEDFIILTLENEALDHIENLILDVLDSILLASSSLNDPSPENACAFVMSNSSCNLTKTVLYPILNINQAEIIVKKALPLIYSEEACKKALNIVEKSKNILTSSKRNRILKTFNVNPSSSFSLLTSATNNSNDSNNNSTHTFSFPLEQIHSILSVTYQTSKLDIYITLFLVAILEHITKDILRFSSNYSRELNKYSISKGDVITAIQGDKDKLNALFYSSSSSLSSINSSFNYLINSSLLNDYFDDDFDDYELEYELGRFTLDRAGHDFLPRTDDNDHSSITTAHNLPILSNITETNLTAQNADECLSDSSTICAESVTYENLNSRYNSKVKELVSEQQQHLIDLNILRRIFMYLFKKYDSNNQLDESIENIFGNINDVYECALKLADLLDENQQQQQEQNASSQTNLNQPLVMGELFWELAEGKEFDVYSNYAFYVTKLETIKSSLHTIINDQNIYKNLQQSGQGLVEISKYLLPQLLFGPVHHFIYFFETIEYLLQISFDEEDKSYLKSTRDTLLDVKHEIKKLNFFSSKQRPIETSFRLFQPHIFQVGPNSNKNKSMTSSVFSVGEVSNASTVTNIKVPALTYNICLLTEHKWKEIEQNVDSLKIPTHINESCQPQILVGSLNQAKNSNNFMSGSNIRYAYLYEGSMQVCKTTQQIQSNQINSLKVGQTKLKVSKRYIYLFDGLLILVKKHQTNMLLNTNLSSNTKSYRFKDTIQLDKCILKDREDELCFELQISSQNQSDMDTTLNQSQFDLSQDQIYILFIADSANEKYHWMSMLCYSKYKLNIDRLHQKMNEEHNRNNPLPIPPKGYALFDQPDTPDTIIFEQMNKNLEGTNQSINSEVFVIKSATLVKLVEHLTHHKLIYPKFTPTFLMFFREFTNPKELLSLLSKRFDVPELNFDSITNSTLTHRELLKRYKKEYQEPIRLKIIILLKQWIQGYYNDDFANNNELIENLNILIKKIGKTSKKFENAFNALNQLLQKKSSMYDEQKLLKQRQQQNQQNQHQQKSTNDILINLQIQSNTDDSPVDYYNLKNIFRKKISTSLSSNSSLSNHSSRSSSTSTNDDSSNDQEINDFLFPPIETYLETTLKIYDILTIHPLEFARQVTLMQEEIFKAIKPNELITIGWNKPDKKYIISPNVSKLSTLSNKFIYWYAKCIVDTKNLEERIAVVHRLLDIAHYFYQMNNFSGLREIYAALETSSTVRLKVTREKSGLEEHKMYVLFKQLFDDHDKGYLDRLKKCSPPCIPFIGIHLSIIYKRHEYNKLVHPNDQFSPTQQQQQQPSNLINFSKYRSLIEFINDLLQYQTVSYKFRINERIRSYLLEDIENYFESAKNSSETEDEFSYRAGPLNIAQIVEARLFNQSKLIEPDPDTGMSAKFPRIRNYNLKSPPLINHSNNNKLNQSKLNDTHRSHSANRVDKQNISSSSKQLNTPNLSKNSTNLFDKMTTTNTKLITKTINNSQTSFNLANQKEDTNNKIVYKRSNSTTQSHQFKSDLTDSVLLSGINTSVTNISGSSSSPSPQQRDLQQTSTSASYESALNYAMNNSQKLSISSADSSAPNSPPPNYEEVFDTTSIVNGNIFPLLSNNGVFQQQDKCFDNKTYYQKNLALNNRSDLSQNSSINFKSDSKSSLDRTSSVSSFSNSLNQVSVFSFPDLNEVDNFINNSVEQNSPLPIINPRHLNFNFNSNSQSSYGPGHRPPTPPTQPPTINRSTKPNTLNKSVSMPPAAVTVSNSFDPTKPPPLPQRPLKK